MTFSLRKTFLLLLLALALIAALVMAANIAWSQTMHQNHGHSIQSSIHSSIAPADEWDYD